ncbi:single-stranded DNA-binding protein [Enterococcus sp. ALS3]|uniref:Single-stranded DNA-binding protein n=1 Tax=Enterococcus alishanensis TaxID=1303817 RepID=A0ABS6TDV9_9ENTE|nr:single-stranded DNA-binding protein [Enterococcus alishanensis]MBV7391076.1 single-stranded DNA-binding protein [Enterococcus alishanensis]
MINNTVLIGRLTKEPDLRYTSSGQAVATFTLAVNRNFTNQSGNREADFINCVIWRKAAENFANFAKKGSLVGITGRIQTRNYENQQGQKVYVTEVVVDSFQMLEPRTANDQRQNNSNMDASDGSTSKYNNEPSNQQSTEDNKPNFDLEDDPFGSGKIDISDDDLPF